MNWPTIFAIRTRRQTVERNVTSFFSEILAVNNEFSRRYPHPTIGCFKIPYMGIKETRFDWSIATGMLLGRIFLSFFLQPLSRRLTTLHSPSPVIETFMYMVFQFR